MINEKSWMGFGALMIGMGWIFPEFLAGIWEDMPMAAVAIGFVFFVCGLLSRMEGGDTAAPKTKQGRSVDLSGLFYDTSMQDRKGRDARLSGLFSDTTGQDPTDPTYFR